MPSLSAGSPPVLTADFNLFTWALDPLLRNSYDFITWLVTWMATSTDPDISTPAYAVQIDAMRQIATFIIPVMAILAIIFAITKGQTRQIITTFALSIPLAILGVPLSIYVVRLLQSIDGTLTHSIVGIADGPANDFLTKMHTLIDTATTVDQTGVTGLGIAVFCIITVIVLLVACVGLMAEFLFREVMLIVSVVFLPLALAFAVFAPLRGFLVKMIEVILVLVFARFVAVAIFYFGLGIGASVIQQGSALNLVTALILSTMVVVMSGFSLPALITFALGDNPVSQSSSREVFRETPFSLGSGRKDSRDMAVKGIKGAGSKVFKALGK